jgi:GNAT superfamily N-acetyltransferase
MWWRITRAQFEENGNQGNRRAMKRIVDKGQIPGILAYENGEPIGWCSVAPRDDYASLNRSRVLKRIDDQPVWSIVCFFIGRSYKGRGVGEELIRAAVGFAAENGAEIVEAYPTRPRGRHLSPASSFMGIPKLFERAGFERVAQPSEAKVVMRYTIKSKSG